MLTARGHQVLVESGAGAGSGFDDALYREAGAQIVATAAEAWAADMVLKVKEPQASEFAYLRPELLLFTYLHLAAVPALAKRLMEAGTTAIAYETIEVGRRLPLLEPMSEIAGRMSAIVGAYHLGGPHGGNGVLLSGVPGVLPGKVLILGGGTAGINAARMATGMGADVTLLEVDHERMRFLDISLAGSAHTLYSNEENLLERLSTVDLLIGAVLLPGAAAPKLIRRDMLALMKPASVFVDIAIDQGGCAETSRPTTHQEPVFVEEEVVHYCVANMPGAYPRTATKALTNATMAYAIKLADLGIETALRTMPDLRKGLNAYAGDITYPAVASALQLGSGHNPFEA